MTIRRIASNIKNRLLYGEIEYRPKYLEEVPVITTSGSKAWVGLECLIPEIMERFSISGESFLEFGVEYGYSLSAFSNFFDKALGVDTFTGDVHSGERQDFYQITLNNLSHLQNVQLLKLDYKEFIKQKSEKFNVIHIDIVHTFEDTYVCGKWALEHADVVLFHDTQSFLEVKLAVAKLAREFKIKFLNYPRYNGLGILSFRE